ncbi:hypothetical protein [Streptomyces sp. NPDC048436]|uniref:hypothetical protein n=1 Tax=Streptomyces sp. NPDC048436 TaxID=3365550 RepID=UPI003717962B
MTVSRHLGYHRVSDEALMIIAGCRPLRAVRGRHRIDRLLGELTTGDPQAVLSRWAHPDTPADQETP